MEVVDLRVTSGSHTLSGAAMSPMGIYFPENRSNRHYFDFLPPELIIEILKHITKYKLIKLRAVNTAFYDIISNFFKIRINVRKKGCFYHLLFEKNEITLYIGQIHTEQYICHKTYMDQYLNIFGDRTIEIKNIDKIYNDGTSIAKLPLVLPNLKGMSIAGPSNILYETIKQFKHLTKLGISKYSSRWYMFRGLSKLTKLTKLFMGSDVYINKGAIGKLTNLTNLTNNNINVHHEDLINLTNLRILNLRKHGIIRPDSLMGMINLEELYIMGPNAVISDRSLIHLTNLKKLTLECNDTVTKNSFSKLTKLEYLRIINVPLINDNSLLKLTNLTELYITNNDVITEKAFKNLSKLRCLKLEKIESLNHKCLTYLTNLRNLNINNSLLDLSGDNLVKLTKLRVLGIDDCYGDRRRDKDKYNVSTNDILKMKNLKYIAICNCIVNEELNKTFITLEDLKTKIEKKE